MCEEDKPICLPPEERLALSEKLNAYWRGLLDSIGGEIEKASADAHVRGTGYMRFTADGKVEHLPRDEIKQDITAYPDPADRSSGSHSPPRAPAA